MNNLKIGVGVSLVVLILIISWRVHRAEWQQNLQTINRPMLENSVGMVKAIPDNPPVKVAEPIKVQPDQTEQPPPVVIRQLPFATQAPNGNWDDWHEEMCEEASMILVWRYWLSDNQATIASDQMETWLREVSAYERGRFGTDVSTTIAEAAETLSEYYQIPTGSLEQRKIESESDLKQAVTAGLVLAPFAGKILANPHYSNGGPRYHMSVITGFDQTGFLVHDVGTKYGANYRYSGLELLTALHDFIPENEGDITAGAPTVLIIAR